ncbi:MAG: sulfotransferase domain-containing protein [Chthoniobacteraceae bacterium]
MISEFRLMLPRMMQRVPGLGAVGRRMEFAHTFRTERVLLAGQSLRAPDLPSVLFFTIHKCASVFTAALLKRLAAEGGLQIADFDSYRFRGGKLDGDLEDPEGLGGIAYRERGVFYGPLRNVIAGIRNLDHYRVILMLRDPRDVLVSHYFSIVNSHSIPVEENPAKARKLLEDREAASQMGIDEHVLKSAVRLAERYRAYVDQLVGRPGILLLRYEEMVTDFPEWLARVCGAFPFSISEATIASLTHQTEFAVEEDVSRHKRQVTPGDHRRKLRADTITQLDEMFAESMTALGYSQDGWAPNAGGTPDSDRA